MKTLPPHMCRTNPVSKTRVTIDVDSSTDGDAPPPDFDAFTFVGNSNVFTLIGNEGDNVVVGANCGIGFGAIGGMCRASSVRHRQIKRDVRSGTADPA